MPRFLNGIAKMAYYALRSGDPETISLAFATLANGNAASSIGGFAQRLLRIVNRGWRGFS